jgi:hypothetical protein
LQSDFKILPVGISDAGAWRYAFIYDLTHRHYPELIDNARFIKENDARHKLIELYFRSVGAAEKRGVMKLFGWKKEVTESTIAFLVENGTLKGNLEMEDKTGVWFALPELV